MKVSLRVWNWSKPPNENARRIDPGVDAARSMMRLLHMTGNRLHFFIFLPSRQWRKLPPNLKRAFRHAAPLKLPAGGPMAISRPPFSSAAAAL